MRVVEFSPYEVPPSSGTVWLDDNGDIWYSVRSKSVEIKGRTYDLPGGTLRFQKSDTAREHLLRIFTKQRDIWTSGNEAGLIEYAEALNKK